MSTPITLALFCFAPRRRVKKLMDKLYHVGMNLIEHILRMVFPPRETQTLIDAERLETIGTQVTPTTLTCNGQDIHALLPYREPSVRALIVEAKFHEHTHAHTLLGNLLAEYIHELIEEMVFDPKHVIVVPIPLSTTRLRTRGYNQTQKIVSVAVRALPSVEIGHALVRTRDTVPQMTLSRAKRLRNLEGAFSVKAPLAPDSLYVLVDDVTTTGTTLSVAASVLREHGAQHLHLLALAH